jgi:hypothetical protein
MIEKITISLRQNQRLILYPDGWLEAEHYIAGSDTGWVADEIDDYNEATLLEILTRAGQLIDDQTALVDHWTPTLAVSVREPVQGRDGWRCQKCGHVLDACRCTPF